ncbi:hypothetical protein A2U01_0069040, partial [Trifolium medium]|nr:hypothetical protein [Trifolium medium]
GVVEEKEEGVLLRGNDAEEDAFEEVLEANVPWWHEMQSIVAVGGRR